MEAMVYVLCIHSSGVILLTRCIVFRPGDPEFPWFKYEPPLEDDVTGYSVVYKEWLEKVETEDNAQVAIQEDGDKGKSPAVESSGHDPLSVGLVTTALQDEEDLPGRSGLDSSRVTSTPGPNETDANLVLPIRPANPGSAIKLEDSTRVPMVAPAMPDLHMRTQVWNSLIGWWNSPENLPCVEVTI